jgi:sec-independent protein translocase protein TatB
MLSVPHLIVIFIVALVVFGPEKIPELARNLGKVMAEFRRVTGDLRSTFEGHLRDLEREAEARRIAPPSTSPTAAAIPAAPPPAADSQASATSPGTVPSNPPNAAALADAPATASSVAKPNAANDLPGTINDSYVDQMNFPQYDSHHDNERPKTELSPEQVSDGERGHS